jgi:hypothetical protein
MALKLPLRLPTHIAGFRVPRRIRKGPIGTFLASSGGQVIVAEIVLALAGALVSAAVKNGRQRRRATSDDVETHRDRNGAGGRNRRAGLLAAAITVAVGRALDATVASVSRTARKRHPATEVATAQAPVER